ncbi:DNA damage-regulated autophagy modulator protein 1-like [Symsagittifera roscoffensis]|uniref:DNA damage-regulated autophagy modulator protein 1-like n=1 Tax=Symsagittifera roscoffensis TaxID=84072 RepID=UPI00307B5BD8
MVTRLAKGIAWLPFANLLLLTITLAVSYSISKSRGLILTPLPFISDTGTFPPASCWFTFLLNATAYSVACTGVVRYLQTKEYMGAECVCLRMCNFVCLLLVLTASLTLSMVASFQETVDEDVHATAAMVAFCCATAYVFLQVTITRAIMQDGSFSGLPNSAAIYWTRMWLLFVSMSSMVVMRLFYGWAGVTLPSLSERATHKEQFITEVPRPYEEESYYYAATCSEWTLAISLFMFLLTFSYEFSRVDFTLDVLYDGYTTITYPHNHQEEKFRFM